MKNILTTFLVLFAWVVNAQVDTITYWYSQKQADIRIRHDLEILKSPCGDYYSCMKYNNEDCGSFDDMYLAYTVIGKDTLKKDTIYDYGTRVPKEFLSPEYDTIEVEGLAVYLCDEDFKYGVDFKLLPTKKIIRKEVSRYAINYYFAINDYKIVFDKAIKVTQLAPVKGGILWNGIEPKEWQEVDLIKYKEFMFIENPK